MKATYQIDKYNNLLINRKRKKLIASGNFDITSENKLIYWLNEPEDWRRRYELPSQFIFSGRWSLDREHNLNLDISKERGFSQNRPLVLKGRILSVNSDELAFMLKSYEKTGTQRIQILKLKGIWTNDFYNRLNFLVEKKTSPDILIFKNNWQVNPQQQITYSYEQTELKTKTKTLNTIEFKGFWKITSQNRLTYILAKSKKSCFDFRVQLESPNVYPQEGLVKYRIGIGVRKENTQLILLYGTWKFTRKGELTFEMDYGRNIIRAMEFLTTLNITKKNQLSFGLYNQKNQPLGISVIFSHRFLKQLDARTYLKIKRSLKEKAIELGITIPF